jgi:hypothetical protein
MQRSDAPIFRYAYPAALEHCKKTMSHQKLSDEKVLGKVNAAQQVVNTFPNLFNDAWLHGLLGESQGQEESGEYQSGLEASVREQLDYRQLLVCVEGHTRWRALASRNPKLLRYVCCEFGTHA